MKIILYPILFALLMAQIPSESLGMRRDGEDELGQNEAKRRRVDAAAVTDEASAPARAEQPALTPAQTSAPADNGIRIPKGADPSDFLPLNLIEHILSFIPFTSSWSAVNKKFAEVVDYMIMHDNAAKNDRINKLLAYLHEKSQWRYLSIDQVGTDIMDRIIELVDTYFVLRHIKVSRPYEFSLIFEKSFDEIHKFLVCIMYPGSMLYSGMLGMIESEFEKFFKLLNYSIKIKNLNTIKFLFGCLPTCGEKYRHEICFISNTLKGSIPIPYDYKKGSPFLATLVCITNLSLPVRKIKPMVLEMWELLETRPEIKQYLKDKGVKTEIGSTNQAQDACIVC